MTPLGPEAIGWLQVRLILDKCRQFVDIKKESPWKQGLSAVLELFPRDGSQWIH